MTSQLSFAPVDQASPPADPAASQYFTPQWLADRMVEWAGVDKATRVLEPSAGNGRIVEPLLVAGATVTAVERDPRMVESMVARFHAPEHMAIHCKDFLALPVGQADLALMNPPYHDDLDTRFILRALEWAPVVVALVRTTTFHGVDRHEHLWKRVNLRRVAFLVRRPSFGGEHGAKTDFVVIEVARGGKCLGRPCPSVEWW